MGIGKQENLNEYNMDTNGTNRISYTKRKKDIGVIIDNHLESENHIQEKTNKASYMLAIIRRTFKYLDGATLKNLYKALVRSHLEYANLL